jgi:hypothetical protein
MTRETLEVRWLTTIHRNGPSYQPRFPAIDGDTRSGFCGPARRSSFGFVPDSGGNRPEVVVGVEDPGDDVVGEWALLTTALMTR